MYGWMGGGGGWMGRLCINIHFCQGYEYFFLFVDDLEEVGRSFGVGRGGWPRQPFKLETPVCAI